jgi:alkylhydroperoxidase family enzyme
MSWLRPASGATPFEAVLALRPELLHLYRDFYRRLWTDEPAPATLLELGRLRIAQVHDCPAEVAIRHARADVNDARVAALAQWSTADCFSAVEQAVLRIADKVPYQYHDISDGEVAALRRHLSDPQVVGLMLALTLFDAHCRLRLALGVAVAPASVEAPATADVLY